MMTSVRIGVLALQGDVREHLHALSRLGVNSHSIRRPQELHRIDGLILPGGESTTMSYLLSEFGLIDLLVDKIACGMPVYGSCAGMVLLAKTILDSSTQQSTVTGLGAMDITVRRNAFGRQKESFETDLLCQGFTTPFHAVFIRAPWVEHAADTVEILARVGDHPVAVRQNNLLATSFHPEMTHDDRFHQLFVQLVSQQMS